MKLRSLILFALPVLLLSGPGCTTRYQDLLRDRDAQIRELNDDIARLRAANADLERRERAAREALMARQEEVRVQPATSSEELDRVREDLSDLDVRYNRGRLSIGIENTVTFASGSIALKPAAASVLKRVADVIKRDYADRKIYVEGHTDTDPIRRTKDRFRSNRDLSAERADVVAEFLEREGGIDPEQIVIVGYGPYDPRVPGSSPDAKARNRRVEIVVGDPM